MLSNRNLVLVPSLKRTRSIWFHVTTWSENLNNCHFCIDQIDNGRSKTKLYDKRIDFIFPIVNFPFISSNIPTSPAYGIYISQLICYSRVCAQYSDFLDRVQLLTQWLLKQGYVAPRLKSSLQKFYRRHQSGWPLRNIHISNDNGTFTFYANIFFPLSIPILSPEHVGCLIRSRNCLVVASTWGHPRCFGG